MLDGVTAESYLSSHLDSGYKVELAQLRNFFPAEEYHQDYLAKNPGGYCHINLALLKPEEKKDS
jgi:peptide methionine sulfoxide reductase MsrA